MSIGEISTAPLAGVPGGWCVQISHPGRLNAMTRAMWRQLRAVFEQLGADAQVRCIVVRGEGDAFSAGGDISEYPAFRFDPAALRDFHEGDVWGALSAMLACDVPMVAAIAGPCMGAGLEIASCCDIRIATQCARFGAPIARLGFPMAPREAQLVIGAVGNAMARRMLLEAAILDARELQACSFLADVVALDALTEQAAERAAHITALGPQAARLNKQTFRALKGALAQDAIGQPAMERIVATAYGYADSAEHREGIAAFLVKRKPQF